MSSLEEVLSKLPKEVRERAKLALDVSPERLETPSISLTKALNGGLGMGRQVLVWGPKSAGKSTFCVEQIKIAQEKGYSCAYLDVEDTFDSAWAERLGVDTKNLLYFRDKSINKVTNTTVDLMKAGIDVVIVDSITSMVPAAYLEKDGETLKPMEETGRMGAMASDMSKALQLINYHHDDSLLILVSQSRMKSSGMYWGQGSTGGQATDFYSSQSIKLWSTNSQTNTIEDNVARGDMVIKKPVARKVSWTVEYNKIGPDGESGEYTLYYDGPHVGIDRYAEIVATGVKMGIVEKSGSWYSYEDTKLGQGESNAADFLRDNPDIYNEIKELVLNG